MPIRWLKTSIESGKRKIPAALSFLFARNVPFLAVAQRSVGRRAAVWHVEVPTAYLRKLVQSDGERLELDEHCTQLKADVAGLRSASTRDARDQAIAHDAAIAAMQDRINKAERDLKNTTSKLTVELEDAKRIIERLNARITAGNPETTTKEPRSPIRQPSLELTNLARPKLPGSPETSPRR
jgi:hypothetical protein